MLSLFKKEVDQKVGVLEKKNDILHYCLMLGVIMVVGGLLQGVLAIPMTVLLMLFGLEYNDSIIMLMSLYLTTVVSIITIVYAVKFDKRSLYSLGLTKKNIVKRYLLGLFIGFVTLTGSLVITGLLGGVDFKGISNIIDPLSLFLFFIGFMLQGFEEEVMCRGFMMYGLSKKRSIFFSMMFNSIYFAVLHLGNPGINVLSMMNLVLAGFSFSCMAVYFDDLWVASGAHTMWNYCQGNIYGILVSGMSMGPTIFRFDLVGNSLISGGEFGLEGGIGVFIIELLTIFVFCYLYKKRVRV